MFFVEQTSLSWLVNHFKALKCAVGSSACAGGSEEINTEDTEAGRTADAVYNNTSVSHEEEKSSWFNPHNNNQYLVYFATETGCFTD